MAALSVAAASAAVVASIGGGDPESAVDGRFEGPEKILEVDFAPTVGRAEGLRGIVRSVWDGVLKEARKCGLCRHAGGPRGSPRLRLRSTQSTHLQLVAQTSAARAVRGEPPLSPAPLPER